MVSGCGPGEPAHPPGLNQLALDFRAANQADSIEPMMDLYALEGAADDTVSKLKPALKYELGLPIAEIEFEPLSGAPEETIRFVHDGVQYGPSVEPEYRMRVRYESEDGFTSLFTVGRDEDGAWHIVCAKPLPEPEL